MKSFVQTWGTRSIKYVMLTYIGAVMLATVIGSAWLALKIVWFVLCGGCFEY